MKDPSPPALPPHSTRISPDRRIMPTWLIVPTLAIMRVASPVVGPITASMVSHSTISMALPKDVQAIVDRRFRRTYPQKDLDALWKVVKAAYGSEATALQAVAQNPTILNPLYTAPPAVVTRSKAALVEVMGKEAALEVMLQNPAVLQCGASLRSQPAGQIQSFASFRGAVDMLPDQAPIAFLSTFLLLVPFAIAGKNGKR